ncbi:MAG TPA: transcription elongation factor Spt5 [Nitrososphaerales archaeon]|nr:transcription elongation factor Spt5 [Nitrososphaerales archaeon]
MSQTLTSRIFAVKTTGGQEKTVAKFVGDRLEKKRQEGKDSQVYSILVLEAQKSYVFFEAPNAQAVSDSISGFKHVKGMVPGYIQFSDIEKFLVEKSIISDIQVNDTIEIVAGPFKGMKAKINRVEPQRSEVTVMLLDAPYQLPVTVDVGFIKIVSRAGSSSSQPASG